MKISGKGQITIPPAMRRRHGLLPHKEIELVEQTDGILVVKSSKANHGKRVLAALLRGGRIKGRTAEWLRTTRG